MDVAIRMVGKKQITDDILLNKLANLLFASSSVSADWDEIYPIMEGKEKYIETKAL